MILYIRELKNSTIKLLEMRNQFINVVGQRINLHKSVTFLYINSKHTEKEIMGTYSFTIASKKMKYLGISLTEGETDLYNGNVKPLQKERERERERRSCSWIDWSNIKTGNFAKAS